MYRSETKSAARPVSRLIAAGIGSILLGTALGGCSDMYFERRDPIALSGGDSVAANMAMQTVDPWPAHSGNTSIAFNGQRMQSAMERYRINKVTTPVNPTTTDAEAAQAAAAAAAQSNSSSTSPGSSTPATSGTTQVTTTAQ